MEEGDKIIALIKYSDTFVSIHANMDLLKGHLNYFHIKTTFNIYKSMFLSKNWCGHPNVRFLKNCEAISGMILRSMALKMVPLIFMEVLPPEIIFGIFPT